MPDSPNQGGGNPPNKKSSFKEIDDAARAYAQLTYGESTRQDQIRKLSEAVSNIENYSPAFFNTPQVQAKYGRLLNQLDKEVNRDLLYGHSRKERFLDRAYRSVEREVGISAMNTRSDKMSRNESEMFQGRELSRQFSSHQINKKIQEEQAAIERHNKIALKISQQLINENNEIDPKMQEKLEQRKWAIEQASNRMALYKAAQTFHKEAGEDEWSKIKRGEAAIRKLEEKEGINKAIGKTMELQGGRQISTDQKSLSQALDESARNLRTTFEELTKKSKELVEAEGDKKDSIEKEIELLNKKKDIELKDIESIEKKQKQKSDYTEDKIKQLMGVSSAFNIVGGAIQTLGVAMPMREIQNTAGMANWENQNYDLYKAARHGDIKSMMLLQSTQNSMKFGKDRSFWTHTAQVAGHVANVAQIGAGVLTAGAGGAGIGNPVSWFGGSAGQNVDLAIKGTLTAGQGLANEIVLGYDQAKQISAHEAQLSGQDAHRAAVAALQKVGAEQLQGFHDYTMNTSIVANQLGSGGAAFYNRSLAGKSGFLGRMEMERISPAEFNKLAMAGATHMGSTFHEDQVFRAKQLEQFGFGTAEQNMHRMSTLASAGSNNPQAALGAVLEAAVSKGLDSSKSVDAMVQHTAEMAQQQAASVSAGINVGGEFAAILAASAGKGKNREFELERAYAAQTSISSVMKDTNVSWSGFTNIARIEKATGLKNENAAFFAKFGTAELNDLIKKAKTPGGLNEVKDILTKKGIDYTQFTGGDILAGLEAGKRSQIMQALEGKGGTAFGTKAKESESILNKITSKNRPNYKELSLAEQTYLGRVGQGLNLNADEMYRALVGAYDPRASKQEQEYAKKRLNGNLDPLQKEAFDKRTSGATQEAQAAKSAAEAAESAKEAFKAITAMLKPYEEAGKEGVEKTFAGAAANAAADFKTSAGVFKEAVDTFSKTAAALSVRAGVDATNSSEIQKRVEEVKASQNAATTTKAGRATERWKSRGGRF